MSGTTPGKIDIGEVFKKTLNIGLELLKQGAIQEVSKDKAVQQEIEKQKTIAGKNILWTYFPYVVVAGMGIFMVSRIK